MPRAIRSIIAVLGIATATAAFAAPIGKVGVLVSKQVLGKGVDAHGTSKTKRIVASTAYNYKFTGNVVGEPNTLLGLLIPKKRSIGEFLDKYSPGSSSLLSGTYVKDPEDDTPLLPATILERTIGGEIPIIKKQELLGTLKIKLEFVGKVLEDGECVFDISVKKLKFVPEPGYNGPSAIGSITFKGGSRLLVSAAPTFTFKRLNTNVNESAGSVVVLVHRDSNRHGPFSVKYSTFTGVVDDTNYGDADSTDFTPVTNETLEFADLEQTKEIVIDIKNNHALHNNGRFFTIQLTEAGEGAALGPQTSTTVTIKNEAVVSQ